MLDDDNEGRDIVEGGVIVNDQEPNADAGGGEDQSHGTLNSEGDMPEESQSPGNQSANGNSLQNSAASNDRNPTTSLFSGSPSTPVVQPQFEQEGSLTDICASIGESSEEQEERYRNLSDIYQNTSEIELMYDSDGEALLVEMEEPTNYAEAAGYAEWVDAMDKEIQSIEKNKTWNLCKLPVGHKPIGLKWVYKLKKNSDCEVVKHKARLVAKGYVQKKGVDFDEVFAPVARLDTVRLILALAANRGWQVHHLDVKSAFLHGELEDEVYVSQPEGYVEKGRE